MEVLNRIELTKKTTVYRPLKITGGKGVADLHILEEQTVV